MAGVLINHNVLKPDYHATWQNIKINRAVLVGCTHLCKSKVQS